MLPQLNRSTIPALNGVRAIAVTLVLLEHFGFEWIPGTYGVLIFFVLSGFLITWLLLKEQETTGAVSLRGFYWRRARRILPAFYVFLGAVLALLVVTRRVIHWDHVTACALYVANYFNATHASAAGNGLLNHIWSLAIEEQFYVLWPAAFILLGGNARRLSKALALTIAAIWTYRAAVHFAGATHEYIFFSFETRADHLLVGCFAAAALKSGLAARATEKLTAAAWMPFVTIAAFAGSIWLGEGNFPYRHTIGYAVEPVLAAVALLQVVALSSSRAWRWLDARPVAWLGKVSYSVYLYQQIAVFGIARFVGPHWPMPVRLAAATALTLVLAACSHYLVERPFLRLKASGARPREAVASS
jgi:peptidoglycan/LPS O-acetylase OafA/YrhL